MSVQVLHGDCLDLLPTLEADSIDSVVTDPPYHLTSIVKRFGGQNAAPAQHGTDGAFARASRGFMGKQWDGGDVAFRPETWAALWRVLKPGGWLVAFSSSRTYHRMVCAAEDAGFVIHPMIGWIFASGFPKATNFPVLFDKALLGFDEEDDKEDWTASRSHFATFWEGWRGGQQALKPALEPIMCAQKPMSERTIAAQVLATGTGALNINACKVNLSDTDRQAMAAGVKRMSMSNRADPSATNEGWRRPWQDDGGKADRIAQKAEELCRSNGRWPANLAHDGSPEVLAAFAKFGNKTSGKMNQTHTNSSRSIYGQNAAGGYTTMETYGDTGTAARFFASFPYSGDDSRFYYSGKAGADDRLGSKHPTVKPTGLMRWLVRMVTPPGGTVLDPFGGSGATAMACMAEGFDAVLIELEAQSVADIRHRLAHVKGDDTPLFAAAPAGTLL